ncbi:MAG TPA: ABC transporter permease [Pirellulales bacterium]|nr:ABC transporter permease [Pirellulales bacterium]
MRPYWAIIKDSFREAMQSRVLLLLLAITTVLLLGLAPIGVQQELSGYFLGADLTDSKGLLDEIQRQQAAPGPSPGKQVWRLFSDDFKARLNAQSGEESAGRSGKRLELLAPKEFNRVIKRRELYDPAAWEGVRLGRQARGLLARGVDSISEEELSHLNRLLLEAAYPGKIARSRPTATYLSYLGWRMEGSLPVGKEEVVEGIVTAFVTVFVGVIGVFVAILVTASIMPQTFSPGAIDLLLSKPISRSLLYTTKYIGGCMFTFINAAYVIVGLWLIAGLRFGEWSNRLLLCIPIFMFLFSIYYAVSALAGVIWRNAIVSVVMTALFWGLCTGLGLTKSIVENLWVNPQRMVALVPAGDTLIGANQAGRAFRWDKAQAEWREILNAPGENAQRSVFDLSPPLMGPVYDPQHERVMAILSPHSQFGPTPGGNSLRIGQRSDDWRRINGVAAPAGTDALFVDARSNLLAVTSSGIFRLKADPTEQQKQVEVFGVKVPLADNAARFQLASSALRLHSPLGAAFDAKTGELAAFDGQTLMTLASDEEGQFAPRDQRKLELDERGVVAMAGDTILLGLADGRVMTFDRAGLKSRDEWRPHGRDTVSAAQASADGYYFAVAFADRRLWLYDAKRREVMDVSPAGKQDVSAIAFAEGDRLLVADALTRVTEYQLPEGAVLRRFSPSQGAVALTDQYLIKPLYTVFPKPGELDRLIKSLLSDDEPSVRRIPARGLQAEVVPADIWGPVWSNAAFIAVAVGLGCWYTMRKDF